MDERVFVCAVNKPTNLFSLFLRCQPGTHAASRGKQQHAETEKRVERNKGQSIDAEQRRWTFKKKKKKKKFPRKTCKVERMQTEADTLC